MRLLLALSVALAGCAQLIGLGDFTDAAGGSGGAGGAGGASSCSAGDTEACYDGAPERAGVGSCSMGERSCSGGTFGSCQGWVAPAAEDCSAPADEDCDGYSCSEPLWFLVGDSTKASATAAVDRTTADVVAGVTFSGGVTFAGESLVASGAGTDVGLFRVSPAGAVVLSLKLGDAGSQVLDALAVDELGGVVLAGRTEVAFDLGGTVLGPGLFVASLEPDFSTRWAVGCGGTTSTVTSLSVDGAHVVLGGFFEGALDCGQGPLAATMPGGTFVASLEASTGAGAWMKQLPGPVHVAQDPASNVLLTGSFTGSLDLGGPVPLSSPVDYTMFLAKLDAAGDLVWSKTLGQPGSAFARPGGTNIASDAAGNIYLAGQFVGDLTVAFGGTVLTSTGGTDFFVAKLTPGSTEAWLVRLGDTTLPTETFSSALGIDVTAGHVGFVLRGKYGDEPGTEGVIVLGKLDPATGATLWHRGIVSSSPTVTAQDVSLGPDGELVTFGRFLGDHSYGAATAECLACTTTLHNAGYVLRVAP